MCGGGGGGQKKFLNIKQDGGFSLFFCFLAGLPKSSKL